VQMIDVFVPTTDGRELSLTRYTQPEPELKLLLEKLKLTLPAQPYADDFIGAMPTPRWREIFRSKTDRECRSCRARIGCAAVVPW